MSSICKYRETNQHISLIKFIQSQCNVYTGYTALFLKEFKQLFFQIAF